MPPFILFLLKAAISLSIVWLFYRLVLHNLTFHTWNRWYLLGYTLLCFLIPFVNIGPIGREDPALQPLVIQYIPVIDRATPAAAVPVASHSVPWDPWNGLLILLGLGSCFLLVRFLLRWYSLKRLRQRAVLLQEGSVSIFRISEPVSPFSFGNAIYVNPDQHTEKEWEEIVLHEYVHIRQRHTLDILFGELLVIFCWYNPFAWLIRFSIRQNLEFIADQAVVDHGFDKKGYQYHLLQVLGQTRYRIANNFNFSSLKKRIIMMNKVRSARLHLLRFLFVLPLLTILLVAFRDRKLTKAVSHYPSAEIIPSAVQQHPIAQTPLNARPVAADTIIRDTLVGTRPVIKPHRDTIKPGQLMGVILPQQTPDLNKVLWVVDGVIKPIGWSWKDSMPPGNIARMNILKGEEATNLFGNAGANGVIAILTKSGQEGGPGHPAMLMMDTPPNSPSPLYVVDGMLVKDGLPQLDAADIESITVLKDEAAKAQFGVRARNGVVIITTKRSTTPQVVLETKDSTGKTTTMVADSIFLPMGNIHAQLPKSNH